MKKLILLKPTYLFWTVLVCVLPLLGACQKEGETEGGETVPLSSISENPEYADLPLIGTRWQLIGFANAKTGRVKLAEPVGEECFTLIFQENEGLSGHTSTNQAKGQYKLAAEGGQEISINNFGPITYINELYDGRRYIEEMNKVYLFNISHQGLSLYYGSDQYLLFKPLKE